MRISNAEALSSLHGIATEIDSLWQGHKIASIGRMRTFGELIVAQIGKESSIIFQSDEAVDRIATLSAKKLITPANADTLHGLRKLGNRAAHGLPLDDSQIAEAYRNFKNVCGVLNISTTIFSREKRPPEAGPPPPKKDLRKHGDEDQKNMIALVTGFSKWFVVVVIAYLAYQAFRGPLGNLGEAVLIWAKREPPPEIVAAAEPQPDPPVASLGGITTYETLQETTLRAVPSTAGSTIYTVPAGYILSADQVQDTIEGTRWIGVMLVDGQRAWIDQSHVQMKTADIDTVRVGTGSSAGELVGYSNGRVFSGAAVQISAEISWKNASENKTHISIFVEGAEGNRQCSTVAAQVSATTICDLGVHPAGDHVVVVAVDGQNRRRVVFRIVDSSLGSSSPLTQSGARRAAPLPANLRESYRFGEVGGANPRESNADLVPSTPPAPRGDLTSWFEYPERLLARGKSGTTRIGFVVTAEGRAVNCNILESSGSEGLDEAACRGIVRNGRYYPALTRQGMPVPAYMERPVRWEIQD